MKLPLKWLSEYIDISNITAKEYCDKMTYSGSKVEGYEVPFKELKNIVVGKLLGVDKHPNADKLVVCTVDTGKENGETLKIVTGAKNVKPGDIVPVALHRSVIHGGKEITKGKLRGVVSEGMLCSLEELGLTKHDFPYADDDGILLLSEDDIKGVKLGEDIKTALMLDDTVVEFEITPNRADCYSVIGLARESAATLGKQLTLNAPEVKNADKSDNINNYLSVEVKNYDLCSRYTARVVKDIKIAPSPMWIRARLRSCGIRPINNIVDITNFIMLEYGQPMHAFDYGYIDGQKIEVRNATESEKITTLDSAERTLSEDMLVIADKEKAVAIAGVMGGENSEIKDTTTTVVFESANFDKMSVRRTSKKIGLRTDSSAAFEKGLDPHQTLEAANRACELVELLGCGTVVDGVIDEYRQLPEEKQVLLEPAKINNLLGTNISCGEMVDILVMLGFTVNWGSKLVTVPTYRGDIELSADIAEEICRIYGYNNIQRTNSADVSDGLNGSKESSFSIQRGGRSDFQKFLRKLHDTLLANGYFEIYTPSFVSPKYCDKLELAEDSPLRDFITIVNPLGEDTSVMRTTLLPSVLEVISANYAQRNKYGYFYDMAKIYMPKKSEEKNKEIKEICEKNCEAINPVKGSFAADEKNRLALGFYNIADKKADFYTLKGAVENILEAAGVKNYKIIADTSNCELSAAFHPGRCAKIVSAELSDKVYGILGEIHPSVADNFDLDESRYYAAEIDIDLMYADYIAGNAANIVYSPLPKFPSLSRDLALVCDENLESAQIYDIIKNKSGKIFESAKIFDVYRGITVGADKKSLAFAISFRCADRTLSDSEVNAVIDDILAALTEIGVVLRK